MSGVLISGTPAGPLGADIVGGLFTYPFMVHALAAGTVVAVLAGVVGWFMVLRRESFAGHTLAVVGFAGASGAALLHVDLSVGYFGAGVVAALVIARLPTTRSSGLGGLGEQSAGIGTVQATALAAGYLFSSLYGGLLSGASSLLFGTITGVTATQVYLVAAVAAGCLGALAVIGRPLLFTSVDPVLARSRQVPVVAVGTVFLVVLALAATATAQITGSLLVFALLVAPAATAHRLTARPAAGLVLSVVVALVVTLLGEACAYYSAYPIGFWVSTFGFAAYVLAVLGTGAAARLRPARRARSRSDRAELAA